MTSAIQNGQLQPENLASLLTGGYSPLAVPKRILKWAHLTASTDVSQMLIDVADAFEQLAEKRGLTLPLQELTVCMSAYFACPNRRWEGEKFLAGGTGQIPSAKRKFIGMGYPLAAEFLRNLGWDGFKPDRHVHRLFDLWLPNSGTLDPQSRHAQIARLIRPRIGDKEFERNVARALAGLEIVPGTKLAGVDLSASHVDNIVWLIGAEVEKKGREDRTIQYLEP